LVDWNHTDATYPDTKTIHQLIEEQEVKTPEHIAVSCEETSLSYRQLNASANRLAHHLRKRGVGRQTKVGLILERSSDMIVAMLGVMKAGGAYVPIDPLYPRERVDYMLDDSGCELVITKKALSGDLEVPAEKIVSLDGDQERIEKESSANPVNISAPEDLIYVIYTSGSTGKPKGTLLEHRNVVRLIINDRLQFSFGERDTWSMFHSYTFDFTVWEMYGALLYGGRVAIVPDVARKDPSLFAEFVEREQVTVLSQTPTAFYNLSQEVLKSATHRLSALRYVVFGGEGLNPRKLSEFHDAFPQVELINMYGITETCVHVTFKRITKEEIRAGLGNIGRPIPTTTAYVMDAAQRLMPVGAVGEICVGGLGVGRGYQSVSSSIHIGRKSDCIVREIWRNCSKMAS